MNATPLWVPLVVAVIGVLGTILGTTTGVIIAQRRSDQREAAAWQRERERERDRWAREDALRNFEARRDAYISFYESLREMARTAYDYGMGLAEKPPDEDLGESSSTPAATITTPPAPSPSPNRSRGKYDHLRHADLTLFWFPRCDPQVTVQPTKPAGAARPS